MIEIKEEGNSSLENVPELIMESDSMEASLSEFFKRNFTTIENAVNDITELIRALMHALD